MLIRPATLSDAIPLALLHVVAWQQAYAEILPLSFLANLSFATRLSNWRKAIQRNQSELFLCLQEERLQGFSSFGISRDVDRKEKVAELYALYSQKTSWGTNLSHHLFEAMEEECKKKSFQTLDVWVLKDNARAIRFYEKRGMTQDRKAQDKFFSIEEKQFAEMRFTKLL